MFKKIILICALVALYAPRSAYSMEFDASGDAYSQYCEDDARENMNYICEHGMRKDGADADASDVTSFLCCGGAEWELGDYLDQALRSACPLDFTRELIAQGADAKQVDLLSGETLLHVVCYDKDVSVEEVQLLLDSGVDKSVKNNDDETAYDLAVMHGVSLEVRALLFIPHEDIFCAAAA